MNRTMTLLVALVVTAILMPAASASGAAPREFFGVMADGPALDPATDLRSETRLMAASGVGTVRVAFYWRSMQPQPFAPIDFAETDRIVGAAARAGLRVFPTIVRAPAWAAGGDEREGAVPEDPQTYATFVEAVVRRYGRGGSFWSANRSVPVKQILDWQVWNEPDIRRYWVGTPWPSTYLRLLRAARPAIKRADPRARVVLAGLTNRSWIDLDKLYRSGARPHFDVAALHPFSSRVANVMKIVRLGRRTMRRRGDARKPVILSEITWSSGKGRSTFNYGWETTERGQAARVRDLVGRVTAARRPLRIDAFFWYTWLSPVVGDDESFSYSGLRRLDASGKPAAKPAQGAFRAAVRRARR